MWEGLRDSVILRVMPFRALALGRATPGSKVEGESPEKCSSDATSLNSPLSQVTSVPWNRSADVPSMLLRLWVSKASSQENQIHVNGSRIILFCV